VGGRYDLLGQPQSRPRRTPVRGVLHVEEEETRAVLGLGLEAHREAAGGGVGLVARSDGRVDLDDGGGFGGVGKVLGSGLLADIPIQSRPDPVYLR
jgi:hypothetical protein